MAASDTYLYPAYVNPNDDVLSDPTTLRSTSASITADITLGAVTLASTIAAIDNLAASITLGAVTIEATFGQITLPQNVYIRPMQVLGYRVMAQRPAYIRPAVNGFLYPIYQKTHKIPAKTGYLAPVYQRRYIIVNPTDS